MERRGKNIATNNVELPSLVHVGYQRLNPESGSVTSTLLAVLGSSTILELRKRYKEPPASLS